MAKIIKKREVRKRVSRDDVFPLNRDNFVILGVGVLLILLGYLAMNEGSVEGFLPLYAAPILLVLGYCVVIPLGILYKKSHTVVETTDSSKEVA
ncbi:MAG: hypothetical protein ACKVRP_06465 [Bacteroidota bacterium]